MVKGSCRQYILREDRRRYQAAGQGHTEELEWHTKSKDSKVELAELFNAYSLC